MVSTNYKPEIAIVYTSVTGNTEAAANILQDAAAAMPLNIKMWNVEDFPVSELSRCDAILVGTYTWGDGDIPKEMERLFEAFENLERKELVTGVFGTGDSFFANYCGAVDQFRDMLFVHTCLAATLKIELAPQEKDIEKCGKFVESVIKCLARTGYFMKNVF